MIEKMRECVEKDKLIEAGDLVLAGVSGGADSVCLLLLLLELRQQLNFSLEVVHVEHGIRGEESCRDAAFVEKLCREKGVSCHVCAIDVPGYAASAGMGLEEAARKMRYDCYRRIAEAARAPRVKVALAHHADDNAETMLFQLVRGSGIAGLGGIRSARPLTENITIVRPLIFATRAQIENYLQEKGQTYCTDATNTDTDYSRNKIRHEVMPKLAEINSQAIPHMRQSAKLLQELTDYIDAEVVRAMENVCHVENDFCRIAEVLFESYPHIIQTELVHQVIAQVAGSGKNIGSVHVEAVLRLSGLQVGRSVDLPYQLTAMRVYGGVVIGRSVGRRHMQESHKDALETLEIEAEKLECLAAGGIYTVPLVDGSMQFRILDFHGQIEEIPKKKYTKWLNYDKIKCGLQIRKRMAGDYLIIDEKGHRKKLKDYFVSEKVESDRRDNIWLLADGAKILWVVGGRISADYKIEGQTRKILEVQIIGGNYCED